MNNKQSYSGTILENTYNPIVFGQLPETSTLQVNAVAKKTTMAAISSAVATAAAVTLPLSLPARLVADIATGLAVAFISKKSKEVEGSFQAAEILDEIAAILTTFDLWETIVKKRMPEFDLWETIVKKKKLKKMSEKYQAFVAKAEKDFESYKVKHEAYLQTSMDAVGQINRSKVVMKDYLLLELYEQLKRSGLNGNLDEPTIESLDLRTWPIKESYNLNKTDNKQFIDTSVAYMYLFVVGGPIKNRIRIRKIRNALKQLQPVAELNLEHMLSDLFILERFSAALMNIDTIYKEVLDKLRPIMKTILRDLEDKYQGDVRCMPKDQAAALRTIKSLFKGLAEKTIVPRSDNNKDIYTDVCQYSDTLSEDYNKIRETIYKNFCN